MKKLFFIFILFSSQSSWSKDLSGLHLICEEINKKNLEYFSGIGGYSFGEKSYRVDRIEADGTVATINSWVPDSHYFPYLRTIDLGLYFGVIDRETLVLTRNETKHQCKVVEETNYISTLNKHLDRYQKILNKLSEKNQI